MTFFTSAFLTFALSAACFFPSSVPSRIRSILYVPWCVARRRRRRRRRRQALSSYQHQPRCCGNHSPARSLSVLLRAPPPPSSLVPPSLSSIYVFAVSAINVLLRAHNQHSPPHSLPQSIRALVFLYSSICACCHRLPSHSGPFRVSG